MIIVRSPAFFQSWFFKLWSKFAKFTKSNSCIQFGSSDCVVLVTKIRRTCTKGVFWTLPTFRMELFIAIVNNFAKSSILCVAGVSGYNDSYHQPLGTGNRKQFPGDRKLVTLKLFLFFLYKTEGLGRW